MTEFPHATTRAETSPSVGSVAVTPWSRYGKPSCVTMTLSPRSASATHLSILPRARSSASESKPVNLRHAVASSGQRPSSST